VFAGPSALAQSAPAGAVDKLVAKVDEARGAPTKPVASLSIEGTFAVTIEGVLEGKPCVEGRFREIFQGENLARHTSDIGEHGVVERGMTEDLVWELEPATGARIQAGAAARTARRHNALLRGSKPSALYRDITAAGTKTLDGREHAVLRMTPADGPPDVWYVDAQTGLVGRIDISLPIPAGAELVWDVAADTMSELTFEDWKRVDGMLFPHRQSLKIGKATFAFTSTKIDLNPRLDAERFAPPEAVLKLKTKRPSDPPKAGGQAGYQIVEREAQPVASVRVKCKRADMTATLTVIFPEVMEHLNATGAKVTGPPFTRYHGVNGDELDLEAGLPITKPIAEGGRVKNGELPGGKTVVGWHVGPYEKLGAAHEALKAHVDASQLKARGGSWEVYWTDPGVVPDSSKWRTQLFVAIEN
jgi:effector-binding domain-containing protein